jgi:hypothetical protein
MCDKNCEKLNTCCDNCYGDFLKWKKDNNINFYINKQSECDHYYPRGSDGILNSCEFCGKEKQILSIESYFDEDSYLLGQKADYGEKNPFLEKTNSWYNWNKGYNEKLLNEL